MFPDSADRYPSGFIPRKHDEGPLTSAEEDGDDSSGGGQAGSAGSASDPQGAPPAPAAGGGAAAKARANGAAAGPAFGGFIDATDVAAYVGAMSPAHQETARDFATSYRGVWEGIVRDGRVDLVAAAFLTAAAGNPAAKDPEQPVPQTVFTLALHTLARRAGLVPDPEPATLDDYVISGGVHTFGGADIPFPFLSAGAPAVPIAP